MLFLTFSLCIVDEGRAELINLKLPAAAPAVLAAAAGGVPLESGRDGDGWDPASCLWDGDGWDPASSLPEAGSPPRHCPVVGRHLHSVWQQPLVNLPPGAGSAGGVLRFPSTSRIPFTPQEAAGWAGWCRRLGQRVPRLLVSGQAAPLSLVGADTQCRIFLL